MAAIERHSEAWSAFQVAPDGEASERADAETFDALHALLGTPCATRAGMLCLKGDVVTAAALLGIYLAGL